MSPIFTFTSLDEIDETLGRTIGPGEWFTIDQDRVNQFADCTGDHQWIHVDPDRAAHGPFGSTIAHGYLTLAMVPQLVGELYALDIGGARINYGTDKVRFPTPVPVGSRVRARATPQKLDRRPDGSASLHTQVSFEAENHDKPALVAETLTLITAS